MGLEDFLEDDPENTTSGKARDTSSATSKTTRSRAPSKQWQGKLDYSKPYVVVAEDARGDIYTHKGASIALKDADDWRRLDENPYKEIRVLAQWSSETHWLAFCNLAAQQYDEDSNELLEDDIERLIELQEEVYWPPGSKPSGDRCCRICDAYEGAGGSDIVTIDLQENREVPVCASHSIAELAENGLLQ